MSRQKQTPFLQFPVSINPFTTKGAGAGNKSLYLAHSVFLPKYRGISIF